LPVDAEIYSNIRKVLIRRPSALKIEGFQILYTCQVFEGGIFLKKIFLPGWPLWLSSSLSQEAGDDEILRSRLCLSLRMTERNLSERFPNLDKSGLGSPSYRKIKSITFVGGVS